MPQMSNLDWLMLSLYFIILYNFSLFMINFINFGLNLILNLDIYSNMNVNNNLKFFIVWI